MSGIEYEIGRLLQSRGLTLGAVESATGGLISRLVTSVPGSSSYFKGSVVSYSNEIKNRIIGVKAETLQKFGAVSEPAAKEMAAGGRKLLNVDICVADTGIAGPGGAVPGKPLGLFYLGLAHRDGVSTRKHEFTGTRAENQQSAAFAALEWVREYLLSLD
jgi:PncC family amidohydrolase